MSADCVVWTYKLANMHSAHFVIIFKAV